MNNTIKSLPARIHELLTEIYHKWLDGEFDLPTRDKLLSNILKTT